MRVADMMAADGRVFMKSEWNPVGDRWPCLSFGRMSVALNVQREFRPGRDVVLYAGTTDPARTKNPAYRSAILSAVVPEPRQIVATSRFFSPAAWRAIVLEHGDRWPRSMGLVRAALAPGLPSAREIAPEAYASLGIPANRGGVVEALDRERSAAMDLPVEELKLTLSEAAAGFAAMQAATAVPDDIRRDVSRMAAGILQRIARGGEVSTRTHPVRTGPNLSDVFAAIAAAWVAQGDACALCGGGLVAGSRNPLLQSSADRVDSLNPSYGRENIQVTHLACNWAKNQHGIEHFDDWIGIVRAVSPEHGRD